MIDAIMDLISVRRVKIDGNICLMIEDSSRDSRIILNKKDALWVGKVLIKEVLSIKKR